MKAMLFAAGLGTRLKPFTDKYPKALAEVNGRTLLEHNIKYLQRIGIYEVVVNVHHFADQIVEAVQKNNGFGSLVHFSDEREEILETGGGLRKAAHLLTDPDPVVVMNVDAMTTLNLQSLLYAHTGKKADATLAVMLRESSRYLLFDEDMQLCGWRNQKTGEEKLPRTREYMMPYAFTGVQIVSQKFLRDILMTGRFSLIDLYLAMANSHRIFGFNHTGDVFLDVGKPEAVIEAAALFP